MRNNTMKLRILISAVLMSVHGATLISCAFAQNDQKIMMDHLSKSVKERDERLLEEIRKDESAQTKMDEKAVQEYLSKEPVKVDPLDIKARPISKENAVNASIVNYHNTGNIEPIIADNGLILYPFGLSEPTVVCSPLRICHIELEEGEEIIDTNPGDTQRWWFGYTFVGQGEHIQPHVLVKPLVEEYIETNLSISTNKRLYYIILKSVAEGKYTKRIGFFYPQNMNQKSVTLDDMKNKLYQYQDKEYQKKTNMIPFSSLNLDYTIKGDKNSKWYPRNVYDDGKKVFIEMSPEVMAYEIPVFMLIGKDKQYEVVNYRYRYSYYVVDRLFEQGVLFLTLSKKKEDKIIIINNKWGKSDGR
jgi:type IV secretion system protein VirB9